MTMRPEQPDDSWIAIVLALALIAVIFAVPSCAYLSSQTGVVTAPYDDQAEALDIVWHDAYHRSDKPPRVAWHTVLDCTSSTGVHGFKDFVIGGNGCVAGATTTPDTVHVARSPGQAYSDTSLAHELWHAALMLQGVADPLHMTEGWRDFSACALESCVGCLPPSMGIVQRANAELKARGK